MILRVTKGRAVMQAFDYVPEPTELDLGVEAQINLQTDEDKRSKSIFLIMLQASSENLLMSKVIKICDIFNTSRYKIPATDEYQGQIKQLLLDIKDQERVLKESISSSLNFIKARAGNVSIYMFII